jgi:hypothetical protein
METTTQMRVDVADVDAAEEEVEELTRRLRDHLLELDVDSVERAAAGEPPEGAKSAGAVAVGSLIVSAVASPGVLSSIVELIRGWLGIRGSRSVKLTLEGDSIELTGVSDETQQQLVQTWLARHTPAGT